MTGLESTVDLAAVAHHVDAIGERAASVHDRIAKAGGDEITLIAVTKGHPVEVAVAVAQLGFRTLGENYAQELAAKASVLDEVATGDPVQWHFIGQLQTNKVRLVAGVVQVWQSVDRLKVGREIARRAPGAKVMAQVNLSEEAQKAGCSFDEIDGLVDELRALELDVVGLMGVGAAADDAATAHAFRTLRAAVDRLGMAECSMGMSADLELAIENGSTMLRIGSDLVGQRPPRS